MRGGVCGWTRPVGEMVLMSWQRPEDLASVISNALSKQENGLSQKKLRSVLRGMRRCQRALYFIFVCVSLF